MLVAASFSLAVIEGMNSFAEQAETPPVIAVAQ